MKYNKSEIMKTAWALLRRGLRTIPNMSEALKRAWAKAKRNMARAIEEQKAGEAIEERNRKIAADPILSKLVAAGGKLWENYGKRRVYLNSAAIVSLCPGLQSLDDNEVDGESVSNNTRRKYFDAMQEVYYDLVGRKFHALTHGTGAYADEILNRLIAAVA